MSEVKIVWKQHTPGSWQWHADVPGHELTADTNGWMIHEVYGANSEWRGRCVKGGRLEGLARSKEEREKRRVQTRQLCEAAFREYMAEKAAQSKSP